MNRRQKTRHWFKRHSHDPFVKRAQQEGYRSRAAYKLQELLTYVPKQREPRLLELGAAPGGWTQVLVEHYPGAVITAIDLLAMNPVAGALILQGDMRDPQIWASMDDQRRPFDGILSDMMPNTCGIEYADQYALIDLLEQIMLIAEQELKPGGWLIIKYLEGYGIAEWRQQLKKQFKRVMMKKPQASRASSKEQYVIALDYCPHKTP